MFVKTFVMSFRGACTACAARAHFIVAPSPDRTTVVSATGFPKADGARRFAVNQLRRTGKMAARAALRAAYAGNPLTPTGYAILAMTVAAIALVAVLSASPVCTELKPALRLSSLFS